jgi:hypothetical protein
LVWLVGLVCWLFWLVGWLVSLVCLLVGLAWLVGRFSLLVCWLVGWLVGLVGKSVDTCLQLQAHVYVCIHFVCVTIVVMRVECMKRNTIIMS